MVEQTELKEKLTNYKTFLFAFVLSFLGFILLFLTPRSSASSEAEPFLMVLREIGSLIFVAGLLAIYWDLIGKRTLSEELLEKAHISQEIDKSGLIGIKENFMDIGTDFWESLFESATNIDIFFIYARTWRQMHRHRIVKASEAAQLTLRIVLPDPEDNAVIRELSRRFSRSEDDFRKSIQEAIDDFSSLKQELEKNFGSLELWALPRIPLFSFYRFNNKGLVSLYNHRLGAKDPVPTLICRNGGSLFNYIRSEFTFMIDEKSSSARRIL